MTMATETNEVMTIEDLAALLHYAPGTIKNKRWKKEWLPSAIHMPGCRHPLWLRSTVMEQLKSWERPARGRPPRRSPGA